MNVLLKRDKKVIEKRKNNKYRSWKKYWNNLFSNKK